MLKIMNILKSMTLLLFLAGHAYGGEISGFATVGITTSDSDKLGFRSSIADDNGVYEGDIDLKSLSLLGLQYEHPFNNKWQATLQMIYKDRPEQNLDTLTQLAFIQYQPTPALTFRAGRTGLDLFMMTQYRNIGYAYPMQYAPQEFYGMIPHQNLDGVDVSYSTLLGAGLLRGKLFYGQSKGFVVSENLDWRMKLKDVYGATLEYEQDAWLLRANHTSAKAGEEPQDLTVLRHTLADIPSELWPAAKEAAAQLRLRGKRIDYSTIGLRYDDGDWFAQTEFAYLDSNSGLLSSLKNGYAQLGYRFGDNMLLLGYARSQSNESSLGEPKVNDPFLALLHGVSLGNLNYFISNQSTWSLGWRYELSKDTALKVNWNHTEVRGHSNDLFLNSSGNFAPAHVNTFGISVNWVF